MNGRPCGWRAQFLTESRKINQGHGEEFRTKRRRPFFSKVGVEIQQRADMTSAQMQIGQNCDSWTGRMCSDQFDFQNDGSFDDDIGTISLGRRTPW